MSHGGDPLDLRARVEYLYINGKPISTYNNHSTPYEKYSKRP